MRILSRYFVFGYLRFYAGIIAVSMLVIAIIEMMVNFDDVIDYGEGIRGLASYLFLRLPSYYLPFLIPVASFGAAFLCLGLPARSLEILATKASGISPRRLAAPILGVALLLSGLALWLNETLVRDTARRFDAAEHGGSEELFESRGAFWYQRGETLFSVEEADRESRELRGVTIYERDRQGRLLRSVQAEAVQIGEDQRWRLVNAVFREFSPENTTAAPRVRAEAETWLDFGGDLALLDADPRNLSLFGLSRYIEAIEHDGRDTTRYRALWHARVADPLTVLLFALLGAPLGMGVERSRSLAVAALKGIVVVGAYYGLQTTFALIGSAGFGIGVAAPWLLLIGFTALGLWLLYRGG
ncbi:MAG: LptF/LptG family permease [Myxococcota bacterium]